MQMQCADRHPSPLLPERLASGLRAVTRMREPWQPGETPEEEAARREAYQRLVDAARRVGFPTERLARALRAVTRNEAETRRFLSEEVYGVPDDLLDDLVRVRLKDLAERGE